MTWTVNCEQCRGWGYVAVSHDVRVECSCVPAADCALCGEPFPVTEREPVTLAVAGTEVYVCPACDRLEGEDA